MADKASAGEGEREVLRRNTAFCDIGHNNNIATSVSGLTFGHGLDTFEVPPSLIAAVAGRLSKTATPK